MISVILIVALAQAAEEAPAAPPPEAQPAPEPAPAVVKPKAKLAQDEIIRQTERLKKLNPEEAAKAAAELGQKLNNMAEEGRKAAAAPLTTPEVKDYASLPEVEQVRYSAREFFNQLVAGDARGIVGICSTPFQLEERSLRTHEELFQEWLRNLRAKRTDLLTLYDIEVLSPSDMEKKYGKPPARLANLPWKNARTYVAIGNLSGHAAVAVLHWSANGWAVVGYAD